MDYGLTGKHVLITGGATGIGRAIASVFLAEGADVTVSGISAAEVEEAVSALGQRCRGIAGDLTAAGEAERLHAFEIGRAHV